MGFRTRLQRTTGDDARLYNIVLYRLDASAVTESDDAIYGLDDKIVLNPHDTADPAMLPKRTTAEAAFGHWTVSKTNALGLNQGVSQPEANIQDLGVVDTTYRVDGIITKLAGNSNDGMNAIIARLSEWQEQTSSTDAFRQGRFGILIPAARALSVHPVGTGNDRVGLKIAESEIRYDPDSDPPGAAFRLSLIRTRSDGS